MELMLVDKNPFGYSTRADNVENWYKLRLQEYTNALCYLSIYHKSALPNMQGFRTEMEQELARIEQQQTELSGRLQAHLAKIQIMTVQIQQIKGFIDQNLT